MRVALVAESFLPHTNGVTHSLLRVIDHLIDHGHEASVIAPQPGRGTVDAREYRGVPVTRVPAVGLPGYRDVRVSVAGARRLTQVLERTAPDVVHLASPFMLGWAGVRAAKALSLPSVAVFQTDVPSYAARYGAPWGAPMLGQHVRRVHALADRTLVPSSDTRRQLESWGVARLHHWGRGVDTARFHPSKRDITLRRKWAPDHHTVIGYVGRLAPEKRVDDLAVLAGMPHTTVVVVGSGPSYESLRRRLPHAVLTGFLSGEDLARAMATFDVFVHCGELETFCQTLQEAHASSVPVIAPRRGGPVDLVEHGMNGLLYEPGNTQALREAVAYACGHPHWRERAGNHGRVAVQGRTWPQVCAQLLTHYAAVMAEHAAPLVEGARLAPDMREGRPRPPADDALRG